MEIREELRLVSRAKTGDKDAVATLWEDITPKLYGYLLNQLRQKDLAEDVCQETWLKAISGIDKFQDRGVRFSAWVFAIAKNQCRQHWRGDHKELAIDESIENSHLVETRQFSQDNIMVEQALSKLSADEQEILRLRYLAELSFKEISGVLEISMIAARVRLHRALAHARVILK